MQAVEITHVLAAVDFSDWTGPVLRTAAELAERFGAKATAVYAEQFRPPPYFTEGNIQRVVEALDLQRDEAHRHLADTVRKEGGGDAAFATQLLDMPPTEGILKAAEEVGAGAIVLGTHGRSGLNRMLMGSVAENVVRQARVPVLTVRSVGDEEATCQLPYRKILCPVNYTDVAQDALRYAVALAQRFDAELTVMTSLEDGAGEETAFQAHEQRLCALVPEDVQNRCSMESAVRRGQAAEEVLTLAKEGGYDLVVIGAQHRPLLETTIFGTTSIRVMRHASCPVFTVVRAHGET